MPTELSDLHRGYLAGLRTEDFDPPLIFGRKEWLKGYAAGCTDRDAYIAKGDMDGLRAKQKMQLDTLLLLEIPRTN